MLNILLQSHSILRYIILIVLLIVIVKSMVGWLGKKPFTKLDNKLSLYLLIFSHIQLVVGLIQYFMSGVVQFNEHTMKNPVIRYFTVEHILGMVIAITLITVGRSTSKRMADDVAKHKRLAIMNLIALLVIIAVLAPKGILLVDRPGV